MPDYKFVTKFVVDATRGIINRKTEERKYKDMKITVLEGGLSPERDVSKKSARLIANALLRKGHEVALVDLYDGIENDDSPVGSFFRRGTVQPYEYDIPESEPDLEAVIAAHDGRREWVGPRVIELCQAADSVVLGLHGSHGENGQIQALLDAFNIKYTGSGYLGCAIAMDKDLSKALVAGAGIDTSKWITDSPANITLERIKEEIGIPCVMKPIGCGSSCGVSVITSEDQVGPALEFARKYEQLILVEQYIKGREITVSILGDEALPITEIIPHEGFYDYKNKYQPGLTTHICPAELGEENTKRAADLALKIFRILRMEQYGRVDIIFDEENDRFWFIEANNLPGMTDTSLLPEAATHAGISYDDLCDRIARQCETRS